MINSIYEQRMRQGEFYAITLTIPKDEYLAIYGKSIQGSHANEIVKNYLQHRDDDGEPYNIQIFDHDESNLIEIQYNLRYNTGHHTDYDSPIEGNGTITNELK